MRNTQLNQFSAECNQTDKYIRMSLLEAEKFCTLLPPSAGWNPYG